MGQTAKLTSVDAVRRVAVALRVFGETLGAALTDLDIETRRGCEYIRVDRRNHWHQEVHNGWDRLAQVKAQLEQRQTLGKVAGHEPSCIEEKRAVQAAKRRLEIAMAKVERVRHWSQTVDRAAAEYHGSLGQLTRWLEADLPVALAQLERIEATLDRYLALESPLHDGALVEEAGRVGGACEAGSGGPGEVAASEEADDTADGDEDADEIPSEREHDP